MHAASSGFAIPSVTIRVSGKLFHGHIEHLDRLVQTAAECELWVVLNLEQLGDIDRAALLFLMGGENREFEIASCPRFVREWMSHESEHQAA
jgi:hypothetical protein